MYWHIMEKWIVCKHGVLVYILYTFLINSIIYISVKLNVCRIFCSRNQSLNCYHFCLKRIHQTQWPPCVCPKMALGCFCNFFDFFSLCICKHLKQTYSEKKRVTSILWNLIQLKTETIFVFVGFHLHSFNL